jgi:hypothetical protein
MESRMASNRISLNLTERKAEMADDKKHIADRKAERLARHETPLVAYALTLADVNKPTLQRVNNDDKKKKKAASSDEQKAAADAEDPEADDLLSDTSAATAVDPVKVESLNVLSDLIRQQPAGALNPAIAVKSGVRSGG